MESSVPEFLLKQELYRAFSLNLKKEQVKEDEFKEYVMRALESHDLELLALGALLAGELGLISATSRLKQLTSRSEKIKLVNPVDGSTGEVTLGELAGKALEKLRLLKVEAELLRMSREQPDEVVHVIVESAGPGVEDLVKRLQQLEGVRVTRVLRLASAVSLEASALKAMEVADLAEVKRVRKATVFRALGDAND